MPRIHIPSSTPETRRVFEFYRRNPSDFIFPRSYDNLSSLADDAALFAVSAGRRVVCACYMKATPTGTEYEFGGVLADPSVRGRGFAAMTA